MSAVVCADCGHPEVVHGGFARPDGACAYRGCACSAFVAGPVHDLRAGDCDAVEARTVFPDLRRSCAACAS